ncbi:DUF1120 domain-containing protein [Pseudomonas sp. PGPR40]|uniref:DUF1120 domain-containing protein n=1 Tax=Pseudomonas sp. PGPR40 TaxID=2913476 RepID=UPI001EDA1B1A|nr:DUF1120 domain-containing protein [Pseudomonas sp. PGPR40]
MNKQLSLLTVALLLTGAPSAFAASSTDLTVTGTITPSACAPTLSNSGTVDLGKISVRDLNVDQPTQLLPQNLQLTVTCDAPTLMAVETKDNREGSNYDNGVYDYGLGLINGTEKLGAMQLRLRSPVADGVPARTIGSEDAGSSWYNEPYLFRTNIISVAQTGTVVPIPVQLFTSDLNVQAEIAPTNRLTLNNEVAIDGSVTLTVRYL